MIDTFFLPYSRFLIGAAYNVQQTLDGLQVHSSNFIQYDSDGKIIGSYWSASEAIIIPLGALLIVFTIVVFGALLAGYVIGRWKGVVTSALVMCTPGLASLVGAIPQFNFVPSEYIVGGIGVLGEISGMIPLVVLALALGWSMTTIGIDLLSLGERYRNLFDHFWYSMAVIAGLFFVGDNAAARLEKSLAETSEARKFAAGYLAKQLRDYRNKCQLRDISPSISCAWSSAAQEKLIEYSIFPSDLYYQIGPKATADLYNVNGNILDIDKIVALRQEIRALNKEKCPVYDLGDGVRQLSMPSNSCQMPPSTICRSYPEPLDGSDGKDELITTVYLASECIVPSLVRFREREENLTSKLNDVARNRHMRWLFYISFSILAGAKVASATAKAFEFDKRPEHERWRIFRAIRGGLSRLWKIACGLFSVLCASGRLPLIWSRRLGTRWRS